MPATAVPVLPCLDPEAVREFYTALGFGCVGYQVRPYLYLAFTRDGADVHFGRVARDEEDRFRPGATRFTLVDPSGNQLRIIQKNEPEFDYGGSKDLSGLAKALDNARILSGLKNDDTAARRPGCARGWRAPSSATSRVPSWRRRARPAG